MLSMPRIVRPDPHRFRGTEFGSPVGPATRRSIKRNKELAKSSDREMRQSSEPLVACAFRTLVLFRFRAPDFAKDVAVCENNCDFCFAKRLLLGKVSVSV